MAPGIPINIEGDHDRVVLGSPEISKYTASDCPLVVTVLSQARKGSWNKECLVFGIGYIKAQVTINSLTGLREYGRC